MGMVPHRPPSMTVSGTAQRIRAAAPVVGNGQWREMALTANWLVGQGAQIVNAGPALAIGSGVAVGTIAAGDAFTFYHYVRPRTGHTYRMWLISFDSGVGQISGSVENATDTLQTFAFSASSGNVRTRHTIRVLEEALDTTHLTELTINNDATSDAALAVVGMCCFEVPYVTSDSVISENTLATKQPIYDGEEAAAMPAVIAAMDDCRLYARRASLFSWHAVPPGESSSDYITVSATTFTGTSNVFLVDPTVVVRKVLNASTRRTAAWAARVQSVSGAGEIKITMTNTDTTTVTFNESSMAIVSGTILVNCEDMSTLATDGGLTAGARDYMTVEIRRTTASEVRIAGFWVGES